MFVPVESVLEAFCWASTLNQRLAVVLLQRSKGTAAARLAVIAGLADEAIAEIGTVRPARQDIIILGKTAGIQLELNLTDSVLNLIHVLDRRLNGWQVLRDRRGKRWLEEAGAQ